MTSRQEGQVFTFSKILDLLEQLVAKGQTGTVYVLTDCKRYVRFGLKNGRIIQCFCDAFRGEVALGCIEQVRSGKYSFSPDILGDGQPHLLPPTVGLLRQLRAAVSDSELVSPSLRPVPPTPPRPRVDPPPAIGGGHGSVEPVNPRPDFGPDPGAPSLIAEVTREVSNLVVSGEALYELVVRELALRLGPMATLVASDYEAPLKSVTTQGQLQGLLRQIADEIEDPHQAAQFRHRLLELASEE